MSEEVLAVVKASQPRRVFGVTMMGGLGVLLLYLALFTLPEFHWRLFLLAVAVGALYMAVAMWRATESFLELTATELRDIDGTVVARVDDIDVVERGAFAMKPSNGFVIKTRTAQPRVWRPGLWWRLGKRIAIGGVTPGAQSKVMADTLALLIASK
ncbi:hypothetical protein VK792_03010 [Mesobacterium sp. TK19101]|uniref:PH domain-containing protein n=1 Tax=Mesobacterium hydrothermale TaxID=3111907 RepID=A0ABU6HE18_9RHOB|nr:hypothetical protein [Mesobacterium sp. TK19101]MEC3860241.1 hypothetical protein [Mesobacterium sp. TK19101]